MRKLLAAILLSFFAGCAASPSFHTPREATRPIFGDDLSFAICSGVMVAPQRMLTAAHCVTEPVVVGDKPAKVLKKNEDEDVALLEVEQDCPCVPVAMAAPVLDEPLVVVGYPINNAVRVQVLTEGRAQGEESALGVKSRRLRMSVPIAPGNSGGGVFVNRLGRWELVGITSAFAQRCSAFVCTPLPHLSFAVTTESLRKILDA